MLAPKVKKCLYATMIELTVKISDDDSSLVQKHLIHEEGLALSHDDPTLQRLVKQAEDDFDKKAHDIVIKIRYTW